MAGRKKKAHKVVSIDKLSKDKAAKGDKTATAKEGPRFVPQLGKLTLSSDPKVVVEQAKFLKLQHPEDIKMLNPTERSVLLDRRLQVAARKAKAAKEEPRGYLRKYMEDFPGLNDELWEQIEERIEYVLGAPIEPLPDPIPHMEKQKAPDGKEINVYHEIGDDGEPEEKNPRFRDGPTVGMIMEKEKPADLVGDQPPKNLADLYARWDIEGNDQFSLRIERTKPKTYQGHQVAGYLGEIRGFRVTEAQLMQWYGGSELKITLYGPDPRAYSDENGNIKIKALTEPFTLSIPVMPPNLSALPGTEVAMNPMQQYPNPMAPFAPVQPQRPSTPADATMHKTDREFQKYQFEKKLEEEKRQAQLNDVMFNGFMKMSSDQMSQMREEARRREEQQQKQLEEEKRARREQEEAIAKAKESSSEAALKMIDKIGPNHEAEIRRLENYYSQQVQSIKDTYENLIKTMRERHEGDLRRADERLRDTESNYRQMLEQERSQHTKSLESERASWTQREQQMRDQTEKQVAAVRESLNQRIEDLKERHAAEVKNLERMQNQMTNTMKESFDVKSTVSEHTHQMSREQLEQRITEQREEMERLRQEVAEAKDIGKQLEQAQATAELLGFEKKDANEPKTPMERFAATAGSGLSQILGSANEWLPRVMEQRQAQQQQQVHLLQQQQAAQQQAQQAAQQRAAARAAQAQAQAQAAQNSPAGAEAAASRGQRWAARWASEGQAPPQRPEPSAPLGFQSAEEKVESAPRKPAERSTENVVNTSGQEVSSKEEMKSESNGSAQEHPEIPEKFLQYFPPEGIRGFLMNIQQFVEDGSPASAFADLFVGSYRDSAVALVQHFKPEEISEAVRKMDPKSPILRRQGERWLQTLWREMAQLTQSGPQAPTPSAN